VFVGMAVAPQSSPNAGRVNYLETIRGLAAVQVLLLHCLSAFAPALVFSRLSEGTVAAYVNASPLFFLCDGYSAVYIFFILSGYVLTRSFEAHPAGPVANLLARIVRLGLPALAACAVSAAIYAMFAGANIEAAPLLQSEWFAKLWRPEFTALYFAKDAALNALVFGYQDIEGLGLFAAWQDPVTRSFVSPLWSLSWEFWGSILTFTLVLIGRGSAGFRFAMLLLLAIYFSRSAMLCFIVGHIAARFRTAERPTALPRWLAWATLAAGIGCCVVAENWQPSWLKAFCDWSSGALYPGQSAYLYQKILGAILICVALTQLAPLRRLLSRPGLAACAQLSFPLYLVHWPILFGPGAALFLATYQMLGITASRLLAIVFCIVASLLAARAFAAVDRAAVQASRTIRRWRRSGDGAISAAAAG
jgi:peptidoglycan/LPS O-acetylase OafA/YrhL